MHVVHPILTTPFSFCPARSYFVQGMVIVKFPLNNSRIVPYNLGIGRQSRNSHIAQVQFRNRTNSHFALNIYIILSVLCNNASVNSLSSPDRK